MSGTFRNTLLTDRLLPCALSISPDANHWSNQPVPIVWAVALRMLPGLHRLPPNQLKAYLDRRFATSTFKSYSITWKFFIVWENEKCAVKPLAWYTLLTNLLIIHQYFCFDHINSQAYHLTRITPILNGTREHVLCR
jgi:hypothetical protein